MGARRVVHHDRRARPCAVVEWLAGGGLAGASVRIPDGSWIFLEPQAGVEAPWGAVDRLWHGATPLTVLTAVDWAHVVTIPTVAEPARIPPGGGTAVLNLLATLAHEQRASRLNYAGPYPTEALFLALLESFRPDPEGGDSLARFMAGDLAWTPAPFTPSFEDGAYVQWRERVEKVVWHAGTYYREDWGRVRRRAPLRVHDAGGGVRCSLWALGVPLEDHLLLDAAGTPHAIVAPSVPEGPTRPLDARVRDGVIAVVVAMSAAPLAAALRDVSATLAFTCGPVALDLARVDGAEVRVASTLASALARRLAEPATPAAHAELALAALAEIATAVGDGLRARAQAHLAADPPDAQAEALERRDADPEAARTITAAVAQLLASGRVDDQPDVERDEGDDGDD